MLTSELCLEEYTYLNLLLGVRPLSCRLLMMVAQRGTGVGFLVEITVSLRRPHKKSSPRRERVNTAFPEGCWRKVFRFPSRTPRSPAAVDVWFGAVGLRYRGGVGASKLRVARGEGGGLMTT